MQLPLYPRTAAPLPAIDGFRLIERFVTPERAEALLAAVDAGVWNTEWKRRRQLYGASYGPTGAPAGPPSALPSWLEELAEVVVDAGVLARPIVNVVVNEYRPGEGIAMHHDYPGFESVAALSLGSAAVLDLDHPASGRREAVDVPPLSLWIMRGPARHEWRHGIAARKSDLVDGARRSRERRVSITLRSPL
jgi:alkylated DNA repair dioxygenase AlkB